MTHYGLLVIGSGPGGTGAAVAFRETGGNGRVLLVTPDPASPYERPPLSKEFLRGEAEAADVAVDTPWDELGIELRLDTEATVLDPGARTVKLADGSRLTYDACVLATGAAPVRPELPGVDLAAVHVLRSLADAEGLRRAVGDGPVVVIGSGFIGCEAAASLAGRGVPTALVTAEAGPQLERLGEYAADRIGRWLAEAGVRLLLDDGLIAIESVPRLAVRTRSGHDLPAAAVLLATGVAPRADLAFAAGLRTEDGRVRVDASMRTDAEGVFAVGDVALATNACAGRAVAVEHWGDAAAMGQIAGRAAAGQPAEWSDAPGFWSGIGAQTLKYCAWGDGYDETRVVESPGAFTVWYLRDDRVVGVLSHETDEHYETGRRLVESGASAASLPVDERTGERQGR